MPKPLNPLLHSQLRLAIMSLLMATNKAEFNFLLEKTKATKGNLSIQLNKLKEAGYIVIIKGYKNNYPHTLCKITPLGLKAFEDYVNDIQDYLNPS